MDKFHTLLKDFPSKKTPYSNVLKIVKLYVLTQEHEKYTFSCSYQFSPNKGVHPGTSERNSLILEYKAAVLKTCQLEDFFVMSK